MSSLCPSPKGIPNFPIHLIKGIFSTDGGVIVRPPPDHRIEDLDQDGLLLRSIQFDNSFCLIQNAFDVLFGRSYNQLTLILPEILT